MERFSKKITLFQSLNLLFVAVGLLIVVTTGKQLLTNDSGDLRNRVTGTKLWLSGVDPYFFKWNKGMDDEFVDPWADPMSEVSRLTVPPTVLTIQTLIVFMDYKMQLVVWYIFEWMAFIGIVYLLWKLVSDVKKKAALILISIGLMINLGWFVHLRLGQLYVFYAFCTVLIFYLHKRNKIHLSYVITGILVVLRPPYLLLMLCLLIKDRTRFSKWAIASGGALLFLSIWIGGLKSWVNYYQAMKVHSELPIKAGWVWEDYGAYYPKFIDGINWNSYTTRTVFMSQETSIRGFLQRAGLYTGINYWLIFVLLLGVLTFTGYKYLQKNSQLENVFLVGMILVLGLELLIPSARYTYYDMQFSLPIFLVMQERYGQWKYWSLFLIGVVASYFLLLFVTWSSWIWLAMLLTHMVQKESRRNL